MNCYYCDVIVSTDPGYEASEASHDLGSAAPRCSRHWRYVCEECSEAAHFMSTGYDPEAQKLFCSRCAAGREEVADAFWAWKYYFSYRSPWSGEWCPALDRLEYDGRHPIDRVDSESATQGAISREEYLLRYPERPGFWRSDRTMTDGDALDSWNTNAERWDALYDDDGDPNRRYKSDEPMLELLGDVRGKRVLDVGSGNGYLCRKLARAGAVMTGVELSDRFMEIATAREEKDKLGITYRHGSASRMDFLPDSSFDKAVSNYVLMDISDYKGAIGEVFRALRPAGHFVAVISHPSFHGPGWSIAAPDTPRREDRTAYRVDSYFIRGPYFMQWGNLDPVLSFHRPLRDYWEAFVAAGFTVDGFEEPSITERGRRELPVSWVDDALRVPWSCIFRLVKPA